MTPSILFIGIALLFGLASRLAIDYFFTNTKGGSPLLYWVKVVVLFLLLLLPFILLRYGIRKSTDLGWKDAEKQIKDSLNVEVTYGDGDTIQAMLQGRVGSDYILQLPIDSNKNTASRYIILKESTIKTIKPIKKSLKESVSSTVNR